MNPILEECSSKFHQDGIHGLVTSVHENILKRKVKFPILEYATKRFYEELPDELQLPFCDQIHLLKTEGGNVVLGYLLQCRLEKHFEESFQQAAGYISQADIWYVCDIIGERVFGYGLLTQPKRAIPILTALSDSGSNWVTRSIGAGIHYAIKKGLTEEDVRTMFRLLLVLSDSKDKEIRQGVGWAAKTTAKFHPGLIQEFSDQIANQLVPNWFRAKIAIGLNRNRYAQRD